MTNTLYLPELREMLADRNVAELREFCTALHPARTAEFMEGLTTHESWEVLRHADPGTRAEIFHYLPRERQVEIIEAEDRTEMGRFLADLASDDRVDILNDVSASVVEELLPFTPAEARRDIFRLRAYPEGTAGAVMTTDFARLSENLTVTEAIEAVRKQAERSETIYYLYVVDDDDHLRGIVSLRQLVLAKPNKGIGELMERALVSVNVNDDQEVVAQALARYDLQAIPVTDDERHLLGIVTADDVIDVVREEATEDAHRIGAVAPLSQGYLETPLHTITWKRAIWLTLLFCGGIFTASTLQRYAAALDAIPWLMLFVPLVISTGGNSGSQSATLIITAMSTGNVLLGDWFRVVRRELVTGLLLGSLLGTIGYLAAYFFTRNPRDALIIPLTVMLVVTCGTLIGSALPMLFRRLGLDPAIMSNPFVSGLVDILGIVIYMEIAINLLHLVAPPQ